MYNLNNGITESTTDGGTVRYHRAEWDGHREYPWLVFFTADCGPARFTAEQGEVMGLTPPAPAPLVVTCNGHSVELSDLEAEVFHRTWVERQSYDIAYDEQ